MKVANICFKQLSERHAELHDGCRLELRLCRRSHSFILRSLQVSAFREEPCREKRSEPHTVDTSGGF